jgi:hypothetical protein
VKRVVWFAIAFGAVTTVIWLAGRSLFAPPATHESDAAWPRDLGTLRDLPKRYPAHDASTNALEITRIAEDLVKLRTLRQTMFTHLAAQVVKPDDSIDALPASVADFFRDHVASIDALRQQLIANAPPRWTLDMRELFDPPGPNASTHVDLFALLTADALEQRRLGHDDVAWQDLEASWKLIRGLSSHPNFAFTALSGLRLTNEVAWKMSAPPPAWWRDFMQFDHDRVVLAAIQYDAWRNVEVAHRFPAGEHEEDAPLREVFRRSAEVVLGAWRVRHAEDYARRSREATTAIAAIRNCGPEHVSVAGDNEYGGIVRRMRRFAAEREGVSKVLALKQGLIVNIDQSTCADRRWLFQRSADGSWSLAISRAIAPEPQQRIVLPLVWHYTSDQ